MTQNSAQDSSPIGLYQDVFSNIVDLGRLTPCSQCKYDLRSFTHIVTESHHVYCLYCFMEVLASDSSNIYQQNYRIRNRLNIPVFDYKWTMEEQLWLFQGLQKYGFGNWSEIAAYIGNQKTPESVFNHYLKVYLESDNYLPQPYLLKLSQNSNTQKRGINPDKLTLRSTSKKSKSKLVPPKNRQLGGGQGQTKSKKLNASKKCSKSLKTPQNQIMKILGFMPLRQDFQFEYDNEAEQLLADLEFFDADTPTEIEEKFRLIQVYKERIQSRKTRNKFVIQRGILDAYNINSNEIGYHRADGYKSSIKNAFGQKILSKSKPMMEQLRQIARLSSLEEHENLVKGMISQMYIEEKLVKLRQKKQQQVLFKNKMANN